MAKDLQFTERHFAHLSDETKNIAKRIVYRADFQKLVLDLRAKHGFPPFEKIDLPKMLDELKVEYGDSRHFQKLEEIDRYAPFRLRNYRPNEKLNEDITELLQERGCPLQWFDIVHGVTRFDVIPTITRSLEGDDEELGGLLLARLAKVYSDYDALIQRVGSKAAQEVIQSEEWTLYRTNAVEVRTNFRKISITLGVDATDEEVRKVLTLKSIAEYLNFFQKEEAPKYGDSFLYLLDLMNDALGYKRKNKSTRAIVSALEDDLKAKLRAEGKNEKIVQRSIDRILGTKDRDALARQWIQRAEELGF